MRITPRIYQKEAVKAALTGLRGLSKRALVVLATGLGKTLTVAFVTKEFQPKRTLFLVHNNFILKHAVEEFKLVFDVNTKMATYNGMKKDGAGNADIVFATWQTMGVNLKQWSRRHFDLVIADEAHHTEANTYRPVVDYFTAPKLGITATADRADQADIREVFGPEVINITLEEAIARGWLPRIEYHVVTDESLDDEALQQIAAEIRTAKRRFSMSEVNRRLFIHKRDKEIARIISGYNEKTVVFCPSIKYAEKMEKMLDLAASFHCRVGNGQKDSWKQNQKTLDALHNGTIRRVCAVNAFNEGVNVPSVGLVAFCRATDSYTIFRQQLGRGLRPGKEKLVVLDFVGNLERIQLVREMMDTIADLHEKNTSDREIEREGYKREMFEVSGKGFEFTFSNEIVDLMTVLEYCDHDHYPTWQEASSASIKQGITTRTEYKDHSRKDPRLPSSPEGKYRDFPGWKVFLDQKESYPTWQEASEAAQALGIRCLLDYSKRYSEDPRLPACPKHFYSKWPGWRVFLNTTKYPTWQEAAAAVRKLGNITGRPEYRQVFNKDARLPASPETLYPDFPGWRIFLETEKYPTWQEASEAACKLGDLSGRPEYRQVYKKDSKLPASPETLYPDFPGWKVYLRKGKYPTWQEASKVAVEMGVKSSGDYDKRYREDPRLPAHLESKYPDFPGWKVFLGPRKYPTWQEASEAAIALGCKTVRDYKDRYSDDEKLPGDPPSKYPDFPGWKVFLGKE